MKPPREVAREALRDIERGAKECGRCDRGEFGKIASRALRRMDAPAPLAAPGYVLAKCPTHGCETKTEGGRTCTDCAARPPATAAAPVAAEPREEGRRDGLLAALSFARRVVQNAPTPAEGVTAARIAEGIEKLLAMAATPAAVPVGLPLDDDACLDGLGELVEQHAVPSGRAAVPVETPAPPVCPKCKGRGWIGSDGAAMACPGLVHVRPAPATPPTPAQPCATCNGTRIMRKFSGAVECPDCVATPAQPGAAINPRKDNDGQQGQYLQRGAGGRADAEIGRRARTVEADAQGADADRRIGGGNAGGNEPRTATGVLLEQPTEASQVRRSDEGLAAPAIPPREGMPGEPKP